MGFKYGRVRRSYSWYRRLVMIKIALFIAICLGNIITVAWAFLVDTLVDLNYFNTNHRIDVLIDDAKDYWRV